MKLNRTVDRAVGMLELLSRYPEGLSLNELVELMEIPKSSCFDILHTLVFTKMVEATGRDGKVYRIGVRSFVIGNQYMENKQVVDIAKDHIAMIGDKYAKSVFLAEDNLGHVVYVYKYQPKITTVVASCTVGTTTEYYNTALGKCMLAFRENWLLLVEKFASEGKILNKDTFVDEIVKIRKEKVVYSNQEHQKQLFCTAVPIFDHKGVVRSALSISGLFESEERKQEETFDLKQAAESISRDLGYIGEF